MYGPQRKGQWSNNCGRKHGHLLAGRKYIVVSEFQDFDRDVHPVGEAWTFLGYSFLPYDDGLSLFVSLDGEHEWQIRMQWRPEGQGAIIDTLESYVKEA
jgi:hypothetical protein